jgi:hypothetical protein
MIMQKDPVTDPFERQNPGEKYLRLRGRYQALMAMELTVDDFYFGIWMRAMSLLFAEILMSDYTIPDVTR